MNRNEEPNINIETISDDEFDENDQDVLEEHLGNHEIDQKGNIDDSDSGSVAYGENDCHFCTETFTCLDGLCEHFQISHTEYYMKTQKLVVF